MEWPAYALTHGLNLFYSPFMGHPSGVNLVANPGVFAISVPLAPVTWLFGPIASLNVAFTLAPVLSALAMFLLLRRWVSWTPAAFIGGLLYGFSPFILVSLTQGWVNLGMAVCPPLIVLCLDELLLRQKRRSARVGLILGLLVVVQFFISTEILLITMIAATLGIGIVVVYTAVRSPVALRRNARSALVGLGIGVATAAILLAYPAWYAVDGPAHFSGLIWPNGFPQPFSNVVPQYFARPAPVSEGSFLSSGWQVRGGYQGIPLSFQYFGFGLVGVLVFGLAAWRRDRKLWFFAAITVLSAVLSLGEGSGTQFTSLPLLENILPGRFLLITYLSAAVMLSLIVDHVYRSASAFRPAPDDDGRGNAIRTWRMRDRQRAGAVAASIVAAIAIAPLAGYLAASIPITTQRVVVPTWFRDIAPHLPGRQVLLVFPTYFAGYESPSAWQAVEGMSYSMVNIGGPAGFVARAGDEQAGAAVLATATQPSQVGSLEPKDILSIRKALDGWGVTMVVIPDQPDLPAYDQTPSVVTATALMTAALGEVPTHQAGAWVWRSIRSAHPPANVPGSRIGNCIRAIAPAGVRAVDRATTCVLGSPRTSTRAGSQ